MLVYGQADNGGQGNLPSTARRSIGYLVGSSHGMTGQTGVRAQCVKVNRPDHGAGHQQQHHREDHQAMPESSQHPPIHEY